jgi:hypothetical protein
MSVRARKVEVHENPNLMCFTTVCSVTNATLVEFRDCVVDLSAFHYFIFSLASGNSHIRLWQLQKHSAVNHFITNQIDKFIFNQLSLLLATTIIRIR